jgi:flagellar protein FliO/FliZ
VTAAPAGSPAAVAAVDETTLGIADAAAGRTATSPSPSAFSYILRMILVLGLVIAAIYGLFALLKRKSGKPGDEDAFIRVIGSAQLATGKSVQVVALGDKAWFLGVSESAVTVISELEDRELIEAMVLRAQQSPQLPKKDFAAILSGLMRHRGAADGAAPKSTDFFAKQRDRIKKF